jgi:hydrogenase large subunit
MNRVEGDVEIRLEVDGHTIVDAWCAGTTFRGYEQILIGRDPKDVLVIAPRISGICSTSQLYAATTALEVAFQSPIAPNGIRIRNLCLMAESIMNDARHTFVGFKPGRLPFRETSGYQQSGCRVNRWLVLRMGLGSDRPC